VNIAPKCERVAILKKKNTMWFGCKACGYKPERNENKSNDKWNVFDCAPCPKCGQEMRLNFERKEK